MTPDGGQHDAAGAAVTPVLVAYENAGDVEACLAALGRHEPAALRNAVVIDHSSTQPCEEVARRFGVRYERRPNRGYAAGANAGARLAATAILWLLNPDTELGEPVLARMLARAPGHPWAMSPLLRYPGGSIQRDAFRMWWLSTGRLAQLAAERARLRTPPPRAVVAKLSGGALLVPRDVYWAVGGLDERFFLYGEDVDLSVRLRRAGVELIVDREACLTHRAGSAGRRAPSRIERHRGAAAILLLHKHFGLPGVAIGVLDLLAFAVLGSLAQRLAARPDGAPPPRARLARIPGAVDALVAIHDG